MDDSLILYSTATCQYCWEVRQFLTSHQVKFSEKRVDTSPEAAAELAQLAGDQVVPVVVWHHPNGSPVVVIGFDQQKLEAILEAV